MSEDICGIYLIANKINGHMYVGQSIHIHQRWNEHCALKDLDSSLVEKAIAKYGEENFSFEIIITLENDTEKLNDAEREWIAILNTYEDKNHYNQTPGGDFCPMKEPDIVAKISGKNHRMYGKKLPEETRKKMSKAQSGENNNMYGKKHSEETRKKMSKAHSGKKNQKSIEKKYLKLEIRLVIIVLVRRNTPHANKGSCILIDITVMMENNVTFIAFL